MAKLCLNFSSDTDLSLYSIAWAPRRSQNLLLVAKTYSTILELNPVSKYIGSVCLFSSEVSMPSMNVRFLWVTFWY